jgi:hypothetical protein
LAAEEQTDNLCQFCCTPNQRGGQHWDNRRALRCWRNAFAWRLVEMRQQGSRLFGIQIERLRQQLD